MTLANLEDHYDRTLTDGTDWETVLFLAKRPLQSAEGNEIQTLITERLKRLAGSLYRDGALVNGGSCSVDGTTATLEAGEIYLRGDVRPIEAAEVTITGTGVEVIGVYLQTSVVTSEERPALLDPAEGTTNYKQEGAARLVYSIRWGLGGDDSMEGDFFGIHIIDNGELRLEVIAPDIEGVSTIIARYDYESNGNYIANGLEVFPETVTDAMHRFSIRSGTADIQGYKIVKPVNTDLSFNADPDIFAIQNEPHPSSADGQQVVTLNNSPVNVITGVAITRQDTVSVIRGTTPNGRDRLPEASVVSIESVSQGNTTFTVNVDYVMTGGDVDWTPGGREPAASSSYSVVYRFIDTVSPTNIDNNAGTFEVTGAVTGTLILVDYSYNLPRWDLIVLAQSGEVQRIKGQSSRFGSSPPYNSVSEEQVLLAAVLLTWRRNTLPGLDNTFVPRAILITELQQLQRAVAQLANLVSEERLERAIATDIPRAKFGIFVDPFLNNSKRDAGLEQTAVIVNGELQLPIAVQLVSPDNVNTEPLMLSSEDAVVVDQPLRTFTTKINPYQAYTPIPPVGEIIPAVDTWTETESQFLPEVVIRRMIEQNETRRTDQLFRGTRRETTEISDVIPAFSNDITRLVEEQSRIIEFARPRRLGIRLHGMGNGEQVTSVTVAGRPVTLSNLTANASGTLDANFQLPSGIPAGDIPVVVTFVASPQTTLNFRSQGIFLTRIRQRIITRTRIRTRVLTVGTRRRVDPVAQTFQLDSTQLLTQAEFVLTQFGDVTNPIQVQIRDVEAGVPGSLILGEGVVTEVGFQGRKRVRFPEPVLIQGDIPYALVLLTDDAIHAVALAEIGDFDRDAQQWVTEQAAAGVLLTSSNAQTWVVHPRQDLTFRLLAQRFSVTRAEFELGAIAVTGCTDLVVSASTVIPGAETTCQFCLTLPDATKVTVGANQPVSLTAPVTGALRVAAILSGTQFLSPLLEPFLDIGVGVLAAEAVYHSIRFLLGNAGTTLMVFYDVLAPAPATVTAAVLTAPDTWTDLPAPTTRVTADSWVERTHSMALDRPDTAIRLTITGDAATRPRVRNLRTAYV